MFKKLAGLAVLCAATLTNCSEKGLYTFYLNPDGSGKLKIQMEAGLVNMGQDTDPKAIVKKAAQDVLTKSQGVKAWKKFKYKALPKSRWKLDALVYFDQISDFNLYNINHFNWQITKSGSGYLLTLNKDKEKKKQSPGPSTGGKEKPKQDPAQMKAQYEKLMRPILKQAMETTDIKVYLHLPGKIAEATVLKKVNSKKGKSKNAVLFHFKGKDFFKVYDKAMMSGKDVDEKDVGQIFGLTPANVKKGVQAVITGKTKPLFNYKKEVQKAASAHKKIMKLAKE